MGEERKIRLPQGYTGDATPQTPRKAVAPSEPAQPLDGLMDWMDGAPPATLPPPASAGAQEDEQLRRMLAGLEQPAPTAPRTPPNVEFYGQAHPSPPAARGGAAQPRPVPPAPAQGAVPRAATVPPAQRAHTQSKVPPYGQPAQPYTVLEIELPSEAPSPQETLEVPPFFAAPAPQETVRARRNSAAAHTGRKAPPRAQGGDGAVPPRDGTPEGAAVPPDDFPRGRGKKAKKKHRWLRRLIAACVVLMLASLGGLWGYCELATRNDFLWLDLAQLPHRDATVLYAQDAEGAWQEYARLEATQQKIWVTIEDVPKNLQHAFVAVEDKNFYKHSGVSWARTIFAVMNEVKRTLTGTYFGGEKGIKQGASTIDQQLIKNLTTDDDATGLKGYLRKVREIYRAYQMDANYTKDEILEAYLNVIGFTGNTAGVQAESYKLFGVPVSELTLEQCASIAAITKNPYRYDPTRNADTHLSRRNYILYEMAEQDYITQTQYEQASTMPIGLSPGSVSVAKTQTTSYFTDKVITDVSAQLREAYDLTPRETTYLLYNGGLRIYTTVDMALQQSMEQTMRGGVFPQRGLGVPTQRQVYDEDGKKVLDEAGDPVYEDVTEYPQAAMVSLGYDGALRAVVGGLGEKEVSRGFNRGTDAVRQVGSTMKPIGAYALGIEQNKITWSTPFLDAPVRKIEDETTGELRDWPANVTKIYTEKDILTADALAQSVNTVAVRVGERAGIGNIFRFQKKIGITSFIPKDKAAGPMVLGSSTYGVTPYQLAGSYMMFGSGGAFTTPHCYTSVQTGYGRTLLEPAVATAQVLSPDTAYVMNRMLRGVMTGYGTASGYSVRGEMDSVGKTGTTSDNRDYWFVGMTPYTVTAAWYGYDSGFALNTAQGTHAPTAAWKTVMEQAQRGLPARSFPVDETVVTANYCTESGGLAAGGCPRTAEGYYRAVKLPAQCRLHAA